MGAHPLGRWEGGPTEAQGPQVGAAAGWAAEEERPVVSRGQGPTGTDWCLQKGCVPQCGDPSPQAHPVAVQNQADASGEVWPASSAPDVFSGGPGSPQVLSEGITGRTVQPQSLGLSLLDRKALHPSPSLAALPVIPERFSALKIPRAPV